MKNPVITGLLILLSISLAITAAGCFRTVPPEPAPRPTPTGPSATPPPSPQPEPPEPEPEPEPEPDLLELGEYYFMYGDPSQLGLLFTEEGLVINTEGFEGSFESDGSTVSIFVDGESDSSLKILDEYTLEDVETGALFIREGGEGYGGLEGLPSGPRLFLTGVYYFIDGDQEGDSIFFQDDGTVIVYTAEDVEHGEYTLDGNELEITVDGEPGMVLTILDPAALEAAVTGEIYGLVGLYDLELVLDARYYQFGDADDMCFMFHDEEEVIIELMGEEVSVGTYTVEEQLLVLDFDGEKTELIILNNYVLGVAGQDVMFVRLPDLT